MKRLLLLSACIAFVFASCVKKADVTPVTTVNKIATDTTPVNRIVTDTTVHQVPVNTASADTISATINGVDEHFASNDSAQYFHPQIYDATYITARDGALSRIQIEVFSKTGPVPVGTYTLSSANSNPDRFPSLVYEVMTGQYNGDFYTPDTSTNPLTITITSTTSTRVIGTFSGTLAKSGGATLVFTNGKFNVGINH